MEAMAVQKRNKSAPISLPLWARRYLSHNWLLGPHPPLVLCFHPSQIGKYALMKLSFSNLLPSVAIVPLTISLSFCLLSCSDDTSSDSQERQEEVAEPEEPSAPDPLVDTWGNEWLSFEFKEDGILSIARADSTHDASWSRIEGDKIQIKPDDTNSAKQVTATINGDSLTLPIVDPKDGYISPIILQRDHPAPIKDTNLEAKLAVAKNTVISVSTQLKMYELQNKILPSNEQGLKALVEKPSNPPVPERWRILLKEVPLDPWGNPFQYRIPSERAAIEEKFDVWSLGPDGLDGTADDIGNW